MKINGKPDGGGGGGVITSLSISANGTYTAGGGVDGYSPVEVSVNPPLQSKSVTVNGDVTPDEGYYGLSSIAVSVPEQKPEETFSVSPSTIAQTVTPQEGYVFSSGTVAAVTSAIDSNIQAGNIKSGVSILGVNGTYSGIEPSGTIHIAVNGIYDVSTYASADVSVGKDYRDFDGTIIGLDDLGWDNDSIGYAEVNIEHYAWENSNYEVTQANKDLYGVINKTNKGDYMSNEDMVYMPYFDTSGVTTMFQYFSGFQNITDIPIFDTSSVTNMARMFRNCIKLKTIPMLDSSDVTDMEEMFYSCSELISIPLLDTSNVTTMTNMFYGCDKLKTVPLLDTSSVTDFSSMFYGCDILDRIPLFDMSSATNTSNMFYGCMSLKTIPALDLSDVTSMGYMFYNCQSLEYLPALDTSNVTNMGYMLYGCNILKEVNGIDFSSLTVAPAQFLYNVNNVKKFIVNGSINFTWNDNNGLNKLTKVDYASIKSILEAMNRTNNQNAKTMKLNIVMPDPLGELAQLVSSCESKGWTITGLVFPTGDPIINYTSKDGNVVTPYAVAFGGPTVVSNVYDNNVGTITFTGYPTQIGQRAFNGRAQLNTIEIPDEVTYLGYAAFADGCGITTITIPANVTSIDSYAFSGAGQLVEVIMQGTTPPSLGNGAFNSHNADLVIKVPEAVVNTYKSASGWNSYSSLIQGY